MQVLIVDDDALLLRALSRVVVLFADRVFTARSADAARKILAAQCVDCALIDLRLAASGREDAIQLIHELCSCNLRVVVISGSTSPEDVRAAFLAGASDYVSKDTLSSQRLRVALRVNSDA